MSLSRSNFFPFSLLLSLCSSAAAAQPTGGEQLYNAQCGMCHKLTDEHRFGPSLKGVLGRQAGSVPGFSFSESYIEAGVAGLIWDAETLAEFLKEPKAFLAKYAAEPISNAMSPRYPDEGVRKAITEFLLTTNQGAGP